MDTKSRIAQAKQAFYKKKHPVAVNTVESKDQKNCFKEFCMKYSPQWGKSVEDKAQRRCFESFQPWCWRKTLTIFWT